MLSRVASCNFIVTLDLITTASILYTVHPIMSTTWNIMAQIWGYHVMIVSLLSFYRNIVKNKGLNISHGLTLTHIKLACLNYMMLEYLIIKISVWVADLIFNEFYFRVGQFPSVSEMVLNICHLVLHVYVKQHSQHWWL